MRFLALLFLLSVALPAQCFGVYPMGTVDAGISSGCTSIPGYAAGPFVTPGSPVYADIGVMRLNWSNIPGQDPQAVAITVLSGTADPIGFSFFGCAGHVLPDLLAIHGTVDALQVGCRSFAAITFPPVPALAGLELFGQGYMLDNVLGGAATSNVFKTTLQ